MEAMQIKNVNKSYGHGIGRVHVLKNIDFQAQTGELNLILGPSGSGKSTFLTISGGLQTPDSGHVLIDGQDLSQLNNRQREQLRLDKIGFVLQSYNLLPYLTVADQFKLVDRVKKNGNLIPAQLNDLFKRLKIDQLLKQFPAELSGGQNQRVAIARALYTNPQVVLADEPTASLDSQLVETVGQLFQDLARQDHKAVVVVTHDLRLREFADHIWHLDDGQLTME